ncbi:MAG: hypothetical protein OXC26_23445 [Albidovulum sp.]|nr:hypothetical protein [Albidovulum sp.]
MADLIRPVRGKNRKNFPWRKKSFYINDIKSLRGIIRIAAVNEDTGIHIFSNCIRGFAHRILQCATGLLHVLSPDIALGRGLLL